jgi:hypothetical protein
VEPTTKVHKNMTYTPCATYYRNNTVQFQHIVFFVKYTLEINSSQDLSLSPSVQWLESAHTFWLAQHSVLQNMESYIQDDAFIS